VRALSRETSCAPWGTTSCAIRGSRSSLSSEALLRSFITAPSTHICLRLFTKEWITTQKTLALIVIRQSIIIKKTTPYRKNFDSRDFSHSEDTEVV